MLDFPDNFLDTFISSRVTIQAGNYRQVNGKDLTVNASVLMGDQMNDDVSDGSDPSEEIWQVLVKSNDPGLGGEVPKAGMVIPKSDSNPRLYVKKVVTIRNIHHLICIAKER